jgi:hypothetical protein
MDPRTIDSTHTHTHTRTHAAPPPRLHHEVESVTIEYVHSFPSLFLLPLHRRNPVSFFFLSAAGVHLRYKCRC